MDCGLVDAGTARSTTLSSVSSDPLVVLREALESEQMQTALMGFFASADHALSDCPNKAMDGTMNSTKPLLPNNCSAMSSEV